MADTQKVVLTISQLKKDINDLGLTRPQIAEKYGLNRNQLKKALAQAGLTKVKGKKIDFELVDDSQVDATPEAAPATEA